MKSETPIQEQRIGPSWLLLLGLFAAGFSATAAETNAPPAPVPARLTPEQMFEGGTNSYSNWIDLSMGGFFSGGSDAQFQRQHQTSGGAFGGIEDFHFQKNLSKSTTFSADGRALFDQHDYKLKLDLAKEKLGYLRFSFTEFRTWSDGDGGFFPPSGTYFPLSEDALSLDRGEISFEGGLTLEKAPKVTFKYTHTFRDGEKDSASWGFTHPAGGTLVRGLSPSFYDINEHSDSFQLDASHHIKATEFGAGFRYESSKLDDALKITQFPGETIQQRITDRQGTTYDLLNLHAFTETWFKKGLMLSSGFSYSDLNSDFSGSRIYGSDFDVGYVPNPQSEFGYYGLNGGSRTHEYVLDLNLMTKPSDHFSITPSIRVQKEDSDANANGVETLGAFPSTTFATASDRELLDVRERLDLRYNGLTNWVFYGCAELSQADGNLNETGGLIPINGIGTLPIQRETDDSRFFQKYSAGARWYPTRLLSLDAGGYYKINRYDYSHGLDSTLNNSPDRYPAYLVMQNFETYDGNVRLTLKPHRTVALVTRYEFQYSTIHTEPDPVSGLGEAESSTMTSHIIAQDISWSPWSRLSLQVGFNYVLSDTKTPASDFTQAILKSQNDYWTLNFSSGLVLDDRTDLNLSYFYYQPDNYVNNSLFGVPYGAGGQEHAITATLTRRITKNIRVSLKYGYFHYNDETFGGKQDYSANMVYATMQYRF